MFNKMYSNIYILTLPLRNSHEDTCSIFLVINVFTCVQAPGPEAILDIHPRSNVKTSLGWNCM